MTTDTQATKNEEKDAPPQNALDRMPTAEARKARRRQRLLLEQRGKGGRLSDALLKIRDELRARDRVARDKRLREIDKMVRYFNGDQYGDHDEAGNWVEYSLPAGSYAYTIPVIEGHVEEAFTQLLMTNTEYEIHPRDRGDAGRALLAAACEQIANEDLERMFSEGGEELRQREIYNRILAGGSFRRLYWGASPTSPRKVKRVKYRSETVELPGRRECQACMGDVPEGAESCTNPTGAGEECGATFIKDIPGAQMQAQVADGEEDVALGQNRLHIPHPTSVQFDFSAAEFCHSTFVVERDFIDSAEAAYHYGLDDAEAGAPVSVESRYRYAQERSSAQSDAVVGSSRDGARAGAMNANVREREHHFLHPSRYGHILIDVEETLPDGTVLEPGKFLDEYPQFEGGLFFMSSGQSVLAVRPTQVSRQWSAVLYGRRGGSNWGKGLQSLVAMQDVVNDSFNLEYATNMTVGHPLTAVWRDSVRKLPEVGNILFIDKLPPNSNSVESAIARLPGQGASQANEMLAERVAQAMQFIAGTTTVGAAGPGAPDAAQAGTATGVIAMENQSTRRMAGPIGQEVAADKELLFQCLENRRDYSSPEQRAEFAERFGPDVTDAFFACDFRQTLNISVKKGTDVPQSAALTQANLSLLAQASQSLAQVPWGQEILSMMGDTMGLPVSFGPGRSDRREAEYRLDKLEAIYKLVVAERPELAADAEAAGAAALMLFAQSVEPMALDPRDPKFKDFAILLDHDTFMDVYKDFLFGERARTCALGLRGALAQLILAHYKAKLARAAFEAQVQAQLKTIVEPPPPATPPTPQPDPNELAAAQDEQDKRDVARGVLEHHASEAAKQADHARAQEGKDADLERQMALESHKAENARSLEQARAQSRPQPQAGA